MNSPSPNNTVSPSAAQLAAANKPSITQRLFLLLQKIVPQHLLSRCAGALAESKIVWLKNFLINVFAWKFSINWDEAAHAGAEHYSNFNDFFTRALKEGARAIDSNANSIISPADGAISEIGHIEKNFLTQAKNQFYNLTDLLGGDSKVSELFSGGQFATIYLSPRDYHRVHMPIDGSLQKTIYVPGDLFSVNQTTADNVSNLFARNERLVCLFETPIGPMVVILVGAMIVASINTIWDENNPVKNRPLAPVHTSFDGSLTLKKGDEMGHFKLGSTAIILFPADTMRWHDNLRPGDSVQMGKSMGESAASE